MTQASVLHAVIVVCAGAMAAAAARGDDASRLTALLAAGGAVQVVDDPRVEATLLRRTTHAGDAQLRVLIGVVQRVVVGRRVRLAADEVGGLAHDEVQRGEEVEARRARGRARRTKSTATGSGCRSG